MRPLLFFVLLVVPLSVAAQNRGDIWLLGVTTSDPFYPKGGIDFSSGIADTFQHTRPMGFFVTEASICDTTGELLFYTNGVYVGNRNHDTLLNSGNYNPGEWTTDDSYSGLGISQAAIIIPRPNDSNEHYLFHETGEYFFAYNHLDGGPLHLNYSVVDMNMDGGLGGIPVDKKNIVLIDDTLSQGRITACKHANGRDWWIIAHKYYSDIFYKLMVTPDSIYGPTSQQIGSVYNSNDISGMAVFSPDGDWYTTINHYDTIELYQFDRCTGEFSNALSLIIPDISLTLGGAFSASSRFLYVNTYTGIFQFDLSSSDIQNSVIKVASWDSTYLPFASYFFMEQLAPDNKIYVCTYNSLQYLHVIESPDSLGLACNVLQLGFPLTNTSYNYSIPNFPNYDLGALDGSGCDTVSTSTTIASLISSFRISPNPATTWLNIVYETSADGLFELFDINGKRVAGTSLYHYFKNRLVDVSNLPGGVYLATVTQNGKQVWNEKAVIVH